MKRRSRVGTPVLVLIAIVVAGIVSIAFVANQTNQPPQVALPPAQSTSQSSEVSQVLPPSQANATTTTTYTCYASPGPNETNGPSCVAPPVVPPSSTSTSTTCSGYPPGGDCISTYSYNFTITVNYTGPWKVTYQGYNSLGRLNALDVSGSYNGTGFYSRAVTLSGLDDNGLTLCATAQKLDGSDATLILTVTGYNETSLPYGTTSYCGGVVP